MPSSTASSSTARPCANHRKNPPSVESLTLTPPSEPLNLSMGATVRDHRNAVRDRSESLSAIDRNHCPHSPESALYRAQGRYGEAEPLGREALQGRREVLGPRHPDTLGSLNQLTLLYRAEGRLDEAEPPAREAVQARREVLGPRHPDTLESVS